MRIEYLVDHPEAVPLLAEWFAREWGDLHRENTVAGFSARLPRRANRDRLPICLLGLADRDVVATATLKFRELEYAPGADYWVGSLYVRPDARGRGLGREMLLATEALGLEQGFKPLYLYTPRKEAFYRRLGWQTIADTVVGRKPAKVMTKHAESAPVSTRGRAL